MKPSSTILLTLLLSILLGSTTIALPDPSRQSLTKPATPATSTKDRIFDHCHKNNNIQTVKMSPNDRMQTALSLLHGSEGYAIASTGSFLISLGILYWAIILVKMSREQRVIATMSVLYLISSTLTLAKTMRDWQMSNIIQLPILAGTNDWFWQCVISFAIAFVSCVYAVLVVEAPEIIVQFGN
eukprot:scaffold2765_cov165-Amphora_coffeaeformis.AAC.10